MDEDRIAGILAELNSGAAEVDLKSHKINK